MSVLVLALCAVSLVGRVYCQVWAECVPSESGDSSDVFFPVGPAGALLFHIRRKKGFMYKDNRDFFGNLTKTANRPAR